MYIATSTSIQYLPSNLPKQHESCLALQYACLPGTGFHLRSGMGPIGLVVGSTRRNATCSLSALCPLPTGPVAVPPSAKRPATAPRQQRARHSTGLPRTAKAPLKKCLCSRSSPFFFLPPLFFPLPFFLSTTSFASRPTRASRLNRPITASLLSSITAFLDSSIASAPPQQFRFAIIRISGVLFSLSFLHLQLGIPSRYFVTDISNREFPTTPYQTLATNSSLQVSWILKIKITQPLIHATSLAALFPHFSSAWVVVCRCSPIWEQTF